jgi:hypothetical protein
MKKIMIASMLLGIWSQDIACYTYDLAVCGMFQNEARFLKEWIEFYRLVGVQHFYLYNNKSTDNFAFVLEPYLLKGVVDLIDWPYSNVDLHAQNKAFTDAIKRARGVAKWVAFLDLDEYLFPCKQMNLLDFLKDFENYGGVCANWFMFGTSDVERIPDDGLMIEYLVKCDPHGNKHVKSIVRPERVVNFINPHFAHYKKGFYQVNADKMRFDGPYSPYISLDKIRINHYWTRDIFYVNTIKLPRAESLKTNMMVLDDDSWYIPREKGRLMTPTEWTLAVSACMNQMSDYSIQKYLSSLKQVLFFTDK